MPHLARTLRSIYVLIIILNLKKKRKKSLMFFAGAERMNRLHHGFERNPRGPLSSYWKFGERTDIPVE